MIHTEALTRTFRSGKDTVEAVRGIDLDVAEGELVAFLGPNGAGKSTTLRMLTSLLPPTSGTALVAGTDVVADPAGVRRRIGYIGQKDGAGHSYRVGDELVMQGRFYGLSKSESVERGRQLMASLDLAGMENRKVSTLSGGQKRRLDIALGLIHEPPLLFLDEPSTGMDPQNRANLWEHILRLRAERGTTIVLTTHYLEEADTMAERVVVIDHGRIIADDTAEALKAEQAGDHLWLSVPAEDADAAVQVLARAGEQLERTPAAGTVGLRYRVAHGTGTLPRLVLALHDRGVTVAEASVRRPTLDDVFLNLTGRSLREGGPALTTTTEGQPA
ncbi:ABC transporter ATP-binding protein [Desertihabitans brevis]|uniref:ABC transporter ATP-binding protein n=1 Tax=Desertihabitans brevis TaxID=2268447 RepID=A0A367YW10_9ACTN|nr:ABC transporter ATP-binding protein [Desertihabitans brevis]RCK70085.1 ABC transporter ATP-binding protein [Desertihabitans brevis]